MLINLFVKNFAIIKELNINFYKGLNILSGETGSGKSLLLKTLSILKGERFSKDFIGNFSDKTIIEAVFSSNSNVKNVLEENGIEVDENIILTRIFTHNSSITKINGRACNIKFMNQISSMLYDIHGQHSQLIVLNKSNYISIIDKFNNKTKEYKNNISKNIKLINDLIIQKDDLNISDDELEREKDLLNYQINEIESFNFDDYDEEALNNEYKKLSNQSELIVGTNSIINAINESNRSLSLKDMINIIYDKLQDLENYDNHLKDYSSDALNIKELIYDLSNNIENYSYTLEMDDERIQVIEDIFSSFHVLKLKYGKTSEEILEYLAQIKKKYDNLVNIDKIKKSLEDQILKLTNENVIISDKLTKIRKEIIKDLEKKIILELHEMNMQNIQFEISIKKKDKINKEGQDDIDFLISTNKGQELKSLSLVSSGGEISRFMLALKAVFVTNDEIDTIIFDEIDTGISGKTADIVGNKLKKISDECQLLVISHLAQIASKADNHYLLFKETSENATMTNLIHLNEEEQIREIARLISGSDITDNSLQAAKELLKEE
ncbi:DNA repair protein RecN [Helcococcus kunzii]|uniref:DNA repair protein RecN n=1 Tax=Helcococcus kunzii ATCC 51366 TaxID=883114 RepID=H3NN69_9FIRM|nr:DNA repair protein RecN [Helcococcus kunzii]EHR34473.1 DNA repair protein RecN [Helcococcus kunzii ATCC 51366]QUY64718.1 DNA repair protein RecN [Helcococcus kunzii]QZO77127.1 DNA repair protein RecN [Helcococcus kunzii]